MMRSMFDTSTRSIVMCGWRVSSRKHAFWQKINPKWANFQLFILHHAIWESYANYIFMQPISYAYHAIIMRPKLFCVLVWERRNECLRRVWKVNQSPISTMQSNQLPLSTCYDITQHVYMIDDGGMDNCDSVLSGGGRKWKLRIWKNRRFSHLSMFLTNKYCNSKSSLMKLGVCMSSMFQQSMSFVVKSLRPVNQTSRAVFDPCFLSLFLIQLSHHSSYMPDNSIE